jgi:tight adherence protein B
MDMTTLLIGFVVLNVVALAVIRLRKPAAATSDGMTVDAMQNAMASRKNERFGMFDRFMRKQKGGGLIERNLVTAGLMVKPSEFLAVNLFVLAAVLVLGLFHLRSMPPAASFFGLVKQFLWLLFYIWFGWKAPRMILQMMADKRRSTLEVQLADALAMISSGLKGGYSFIQGLGMASDQMPAPISDEFRRVIRLIQLGVDTSRALEQMGERINSYDYDMTISATNIQLASGGNLSALLERIAETIRDRIRLRRDIAALTAQGRISGGILIALPIGIALMLRVINPEYMGYLTRTDLGNNLIYLAMGQQAIGIYWIKKLLDFDN